jgi:hypothetical protein
MHFNLENKFDHTNILFAIALHFSINRTYNSVENSTSHVFQLKSYYLIIFFARLLSRYVEALLFQLFMSVSFFLNCFFLIWTATNFFSFISEECEFDNEN